MTVTQEPDLTALARTDRRVARELAEAETARRAVQDRIVGADAAADRALRVKEGQLRLAEQEDEVRANRAARRRQLREQERDARRKRKEKRRAARAVWFAGRVQYVRDNVAGVYSGVIYALAVSGAVYGQVDAARTHGLPVEIGIIAAAAIEGTGLAMALTAQHQRLQGERALAARALIWIATAAAVAINYFGHAADSPVKALGLSALSALGIIVYEVRSGAKHRPALRAKGMIPEPPERFGWRRWLAYPGPTWLAWRLDVRDRLSVGAAALVARAEAARADRARHALVAEVAERARKAAKAATKRGDAGAALAALVQLAHTGTPAPLLALPSTAHVQAQTAWAEAATTRAEAEAARAGQAEAEARAAAAAAYAEAEAATRAEAEAAARTVRTEAEAEVAAAHRRAEAEVRARVEAEARAGAEATARAEAEAAARTATAEARAEAARASRGTGHAEAEAAAAQQARTALQEEQRRRAVAETELARLVGVDVEAEQLRERVTELESELGRRARRAAPSVPAEPLVFDGIPVPAVTGVSGGTVLRVLQARKDNPGATQKELAAELDITDRTVRTVLAAVPAATAAMEGAGAR